MSPLCLPEALCALAAFRPQLERALEQSWDDATFPELWGAVEGGLAQVWSDGDVAVVTSKPDDDAVIWLTAGDWRASGRTPAQAVASFLPAIQQWAEGLGARRLTVYGRRGWAPLLRPYGYEHQWSVLVKPLRQG